MFTDMCIGAAQGSSVQDTTIYLGTGHTGLAGAAGSGGSHAGVTVIGGQFGLDLSLAQPAPTVTGMTLINQSKSAILYNKGKEALSTVGIKIVMAPKATVAVSASGVGARYGLNINQMSFIDTTIDCALTVEAATAFKTSASLYLRNIFLRGCTSAVESPSLHYPTPRVSEHGAWANIVELAAGVNVRSSNGYCSNWNMDLWIDGKRQASAILVNTSSAVVPDTELPDVASLHLWDEATFPTFDLPDADMVNVKAAPFGAKGDARTDDADAIQHAIDSGAAIVLVPKGFYRLSRSLVLRPSTKLIGVARTISVLMAMSDGLGSGTPQPLVRPLFHSVSFSFGAVDRRSRGWCCSCSVGGVGWGWGGSLLSCHQAWLQQM